MQDEFIFDNKAHAYFLDGKPLHGITTVLGVISKPALIQWAAKMACEYVGAQVALKYSPSLDLFSITKAEMEVVLKDASVSHRKKKEDAAEKGTDLHALVEEYVGWCISQNSGSARHELGMTEMRKYTPISEFIMWASENNIKFLASEQRLYSKEHWVAGTCDLVFEKDGKTYVGDIKTYKKIWDRVPFFQCAAYGMMWEEMERQTNWMSDDTTLRPKVIDGYCVLRLSKDGTFEALWSFDVEGDRSAFLNALGLFKALQAFEQIKTSL